jgi:hypothetical protein
MSFHISWSECLHFLSLANAQWIFPDDIFWKCDEGFDKGDFTNAAECLAFIKDYTQVQEKVIAAYDWVLVN